MKKYIHKVQYYETDKMGITHHSNYIRFMEEARVDFLEQIGWGFDKMEEMGIGSPVVKLDCEYKQPTKFADRIEIEVKVLECSAVKLKIGYSMEANGAVCCTGTSTHCFTGKDGRPMIIQRSLPDFYQALMQHTESGISQVQK